MCFSRSSWPPHHRRHLPVSQTDWPWCSSISASLCSAHRCCLHPLGRLGSFRRGATSGRLHLQPRETSIIKRRCCSRHAMRGCTFAPKAIKSFSRGETRSHVYGQCCTDANHHLSRTASQGVQRRGGVAQGRMHAPQRIGISPRS
jgi:hypothetical protein